MCNLTRLILILFNLAVDFIKDRVKAVAMTNSVHARDLIEGDGRRAFMFDVSRHFNFTYLHFGLTEWRGRGSFFPPLSLSVNRIV